MPWIWLIWMASVCTITTGIHQDGSKIKNSDKKVEFKNFPLDLMTESSANSKRPNPQKTKGDEDKKTLSHQVADGKYGLLQKEFPPIKRPGVISYETNNEVPNDNANNYGGLNESEIWLAENHLLILRGGSYPTEDTYPDYSKPVWTPIDDFIAPRRQVKIPKNPKVPPPFPVQLTDDGPLQILGTNFTRTLNASFEYPLSPLDGYNPEYPSYPAPEYPVSPNFTTRKTPFPASPNSPPIEGDINKPGNGPPQFPFPVNGAAPPFFDSLPPGSVILPPPNNTEDYDEDDLSIYYPPPYSFYYPKDNSSVVPAGPLVPGIVLPPPPDFFGSFPTFTPTKPPIRTIPTKPKTTTTTTTTSTTTTTTTTTARPQTVKTTTTLKPRIRPFYLPTEPPRVYPENIPQRPKIPLPETKPQRPIYYPNEIPKVVSPRPVYYPNDVIRPRNKTVSVTILRPVKPTQTPPPVYIYENDIPSKPFEEYGPPRYNKKVSITTTRIPLRAYYSTSSNSNDIETNLVTKLPERNQNYNRGLVQRTRPKQPTQIYYYDDGDNLSNTITPYPIVQPKQYINSTNNRYLPVPPQPQYYFVPNSPYVTQRPQYRPIPSTYQPNNNNNFKTHLIKLQQQIEAYQKPPSEYRPSVFEMHNPTPNNVPSSKPVYQYSFEVANYQQQHSKFQNQDYNQNQQNKFKIVPQYSVQIEPAIEITTTEKPQVQYQNYRENSQRNPKFYQNNYYQENVVTANPLRSERYTVTPNPAYQPYYTQQEESYFDDITKKHFTMFGQKLQATTPIPPQINQQPIYVPPAEPNLRIRPNRPLPLKDNLIINYLNQGNVPQSYQQVPKQVPQYQPPRYQQSNENYQRRPNAPPSNVETIPAISLPSRGANDDKSGSFISYELPGDDGAHFYFLTPQLRQKNDEQRGVSYYYAQPAPGQTDPRRTRNY